MPYHVYEKLNLGELQATSVSIQLADRTIRYPKGILEDVLVKVEELILPADFLVLEMEEAPIHDNQLPLILGRPFMATAGAIIDVKKGTLTMNVFDETIAFKVFEASKFPSDEHEVFQLDAIDTMVKEALPMSYLEPIEACITQSIEKRRKAVISPLLLELVCSMDSYIEVGKRYANQFESLPPPTNKVLPSVVRGTELELKQLPKHLKYAYLGIVLGHVISSKGIEVDKAKIDLIASMPSPTSVKEVRSFLGHAGFYRHFIKDFSKIARPLCNLLAKDMDFAFDQDCENAFNALKKMLTTAPIIIPPIGACLLN
ncbi:unnamed protein product [Prunus brigantina]